MLKDGISDLLFAPQGKLLCHVARFLQIAFRISIFYLLRSETLLSKNWCRLRNSILRVWISQRNVASPWQRILKSLSLVVFILIVVYDWTACWVVPISGPWLLMFCLRVVDSRREWSRSPFLFVWRTKISQLLSIFWENFTANSCISPFSRAFWLRIT